MKALSLWQPWASLWLQGPKVHETRSWPTPHRGPLLVHAAQTFIRDIEPEDPLRGILDDEFGGHWAMDLPTGALIGVVDLLDCRCIAGDETATDADDLVCGDFHPGRYAWRRGQRWAFDHPIPFRGRQSLFEVTGFPALDQALRERKLLP